MLDSPTSANIEDFRQRYRNTYGFLKRKDNADLLIYIKETGHDRVTFTNTLGQEFYANLNKDVMFEFLPIIRGWYATRLGPRFFMRVAERQYHRGISRGNTTVYSINLATDRLAIDALRMDVLEDIFVLKFPSPTFSSYQRCTADYFIPSKHFLLTGLSLYMYDRKIGDIDPTRTKLVLSDKTFQQEVSDFIRRQNLPLEVVANG